MNLVNNSLESVKSSGTVTIKTEIKTVEDEDVDTKKTEEVVESENGEKEFEIEI